MIEVRVLILAHMQDKLTSAISQCIAHASNSCIKVQGQGHAIRLLQETINQPWILDCHCLYLCLLAPLE